MAENYHCIKEGELSNLRETVASLKSDAAWREKRVAKVEVKCDDMATITTSISVMALSLEHIVEHNHRQDDMMRNQIKTLERMNENLTNLNQGQSNLEKKVEKLEVRVDNNETLNTVDLRGINKYKNEEYLKKYAGPIVAGMAMGAIILQIIMALK